MGRNPEWPPKIELWYIYEIAGISLDVLGGWPLFIKTPCCRLNRGTLSRSLSNLAITPARGVSAAPFALMVSTSKIERVVKVIDWGAGASLKAGVKVYWFAAVSIQNQPDPKLFGFVGSEMGFIIIIFFNHHLPPQSSLESLLLDVPNLQRKKNNPPQLLSSLSFPPWTQIKNPKIILSSSSSSSKIQTQIYQIWTRYCLLPMGGCRRIEEKSEWMREWESLCTLPREWEWRGQQVQRPSVYWAKTGPTRLRLEI